ncbi:hypothetical protein ACFFVB_12580 [Formosa undariae]|uniref:Uncharacterized protein n=1 Tax=Formosa undariae TaxID=1325436 RepID=A0ABV5F3E8_9FLAO
MYFYIPIYNNTIGTTYLIKTDLDALTGSEKIQLLLGDIAMLLDENELVQLLKTIASAKKGCSCKECNENHDTKSLIFKSAYSTVHFKSNKTNLVALQDLIKGTLFELELSSILHLNNIPL